MSSSLASPRPPWTIGRAPGPVVVTAVHGGHDLRPEVSALMALSDEERRLEEDPHTGEWADIGDTRFVVHRSRFEVDLNRDRDHAVYATPEQAWGLKVWRAEPPDGVAEESRRLHDSFYEELYNACARVERAWNRFVVLDLHTYNHRRGRAGADPADPAANPDVNVGTGSLDRRKWGPLVDRLMHDLGAQEVGGRGLDARENIRFEGAHLVQWVHATFPTSGCALAIEVKKFFMDEHSGDLDPVLHKEIHRALETAASGCRQQVRA